MPPTTSYSFGDIVLVSFPFTDQSAAKQRPAVIISSPAYHEARPDLIIMAVTSQIRPSATFGEIQIGNWQAAGLLKPSSIKPVIATVEHMLVIKRLGRLNQQDQQTLRAAMTKRTQKTPRQDIEIAAKRFRQLANERKHK
jgi:mRNA interferase MazF